MLPAWTLLPFGLYLLAIAILPLVAPVLWESNRNKLLVALAAAAPVVAYLLLAQPRGGHWLADSACEYVAFIALLASLFTVSGGVYLGGRLAGTPLVNTAVMATGAVIANVVGTTGASMLLIRPLLRANATRTRTAHIVVFFIFIVSNAAGALTPLGDPPLFLGFLRGVPFFWTLRLLAPWAFVNGALLVLFNVMDQVILNKEERERPGSQLEDVQRDREPLRLEGARNLGWLAVVVVVVYLFGAEGASLGVGPHARALLQAGVLATIAALAFATTPRHLRAANAFTWTPIIEVAVIFVGIFATMVPALKVLEESGADIGLSQPWQLFWATGLLSSFLDNAPTYLTFASVSVGIHNAAHGTNLSAADLSGLARSPVGAPLLAAVSCGAVFMGAVTYIGNGPNFMVKAIAEAHRVRMPGFFGYIAWSAVILLPLFALVSWLFFA